MILLGTSADQCTVESFAGHYTPPAYFDDDDLSCAKRAAEKPNNVASPAEVVPPSTSLPASAMPATAYFDDDDTSAAKRLSTKVPSESASDTVTATIPALAVAPVDSPPPYASALPAAALLPVHEHNHEHGHLQCNCATPTEVCKAHGHDPQIDIVLATTAAAFFPPALYWVLHKRKRECRRCGEWVQATGCCKISMAGKRLKRMRSKSEEEAK